MAVGRQGSDQQTHFLRKTVNFGDTNIATGVKMGTLPLGAHILQTSVHIRTVFNAATTNVLTVGTNSTAYDNMINAAAVAEGTLGYTVAAPNADIVYPTGDLDVFAKFTQSGTAATTGQADIVVTYVPDDQQYV